jgi:hypothetical protein
VIREVRFTSAGSAPGEDEPRVVFPDGTRRVAWQARLATRYDDYLEQLNVRLLDPAGTPVSDTPVRRGSRPWIGAELHLPPASAEGKWTAEVRFQNDVLDRQSFRLQPTAR